MTIESKSVSVPASDTEINNTTICGTRTALRTVPRGRYFHQFHPLAFSFANWVSKPIVIATSSNSQNFAHHINRPTFQVVALYKLIDQRPLLEMMLKVFFWMSRSVSASYNLFSSSAIFFASSLRDWTPLPEKLDAPFAWYSLRHLYNNSGSTHSSYANSDNVRALKTQLDGIRFKCLVIMRSLFSHNTQN